MKAELVSIGTELTSGRSLDTNAQWLSRQLAEIGIPVAYHTTVADDLADKVEVFKTATQRAALVISTGGLGPTQDDLTREVLAQVAGVELIEDAATLEHVRAMFAQRGRSMPERNRVQALFPRGAEIVANPAGTAPGIWLHIGNALVVALPGVPSEMHRMFTETVGPRLVALGIGAGVLIERKLNAFGAGESTIEEALGELTARGHDPEVGITASDATISLRILAHAPTRAAAEAKAAPVEEMIRQRLGSLIFGTGDETLPQVIIRQLNNKRRTLAVAEGVTGGLLAARLTEVPGASGWFRGGLVAYANEVKRLQLGVPEELLEEEGAVSRAVAEAMARGCRTLFATDLALSTVGIAGPDPLSAEQPVGVVHVALAHAHGCVRETFNWSGNRQQVQNRACKLALNLVRLHLND